MASSSNSSATTTTLHSPTYGSDPTTPNTTFVQADPSNFRAVVQKLTGASDDPSAQKLPLTLPSRLSAQTQAHSDAIGPKKPNFKLHERRAKKLHELNIGVSERVLPLNMMFYGNGNGSMMTSPPSSYFRGRGALMGSPVSPLEVLARGSPKSPHEEEEERAIAGKGFYLHPSPLSTPRSASQQPPELLPLFPLHSPSHHNS